MSVMPGPSLEDCRQWLKAAFAEAEAGLKEGGLPIGSVIVDPENGEIISRGHNLRVQTGDPTAHAEVVAIRNAGRRRDWHKLALVSTLSPCIMCTGATLLYKIPLIVVGENVNFSSFAESVLAAGDGRNKPRVILLNDDLCKSLMAEFVATHPDLWFEDIHVVAKP